MGHTDSVSSARSATERRALPVVLLAVMVGALLVLAGVSKMPCLGRVTDDNRIVTHQCFTEVGTFYATRGLAEEFTPFYGESTRYPTIEYPVVSALVLEGAAWVTHRIHGVTADVQQHRSQVPVESVQADPLVISEGRTFTALMFLLLGSVGGVGLVLLLRTLSPHRAVTMLAVTAPAVILTAFVNLDLLVLGSVGIALWAWSRQRPWTVGLAVGLGAGAKLVPALLLIGVVGVLLAHRRNRKIVRQTPTVLGASALTFVLINLPAVALHPDAWARFWTFSRERPEYFGSVWMALRMVRGHAVPVSLMNEVALAAVLLAAAVGVWIATRTPVAMAMALGAIPAMVTFVDVNKVVSPQYSIWLVPLIVAVVPLGLAAAFTAAHVAHYVETWLYIKGISTPPVGVDKWYLAAIAGRAVSDGFLFLWVGWRAIQGKPSQQIGHVEATTSARRSPS